MSPGPYILGLTGSVGMGKSTTANIFREAGVPVWDADAVVHKLYATGGAAVDAIKAIAPDTIVNNAVDRGALGAAILKDPDLLKKVEAAVHPLVSNDRRVFWEQNEHEKLVVCDIPLLFETGINAWVDGVLLVTASPEIQKQRVMDRPGMTVEMFETILSKQMPDSEKRKRADFILDTGKGLDHARAEVHSLIEKLRGLDA